MNVTKNEYEKNLNLSLKSINDEFRKDIFENSKKLYTTFKKKYSTIKVYCTFKLWNVDSNLYIFWQNSISF